MMSTIIAAGWMTLSLALLSAVPSLGQTALTPAAIAAALSKRTPAPTIAKAAIPAATPAPSLVKAAIPVVTSAASLANARPAADADVCNPRCSSGQYVLKGKCTECVSGQPTRSMSTYRGIRCQNPRANNSPDKCSPGTLFSVLIAKVSNDVGTKSCISYKPFKLNGRTNKIDGGVRTTLLLPPKGYFTLSGLSLANYNLGSLSLAGIPGKKAAVQNVVKGKTRGRVDFDDTEGVLARAAGETVRLTGSFKASSDLNLCFSADVEVCS